MDCFFFKDFDRFLSIELLSGQIHRQESKISCEAESFHEVLSFRKKNKKL